MKTEDMVMHHEFPVGSVVYWVSPGVIAYRGIGYGPREAITSGIVIEEYPTCLAAKNLVPRDRRLINGIPIADLETPTRWHKLPKNWTYYTELFTQSDSPLLPDETVAPSSPDEILRCYEKGYLVDALDYDWCTIDAEIEKDKGWRLVRKYNDWFPPPVSAYSTIPMHLAFKTFQEAMDYARKEEAEILRQRNLTDLDWSIEQIQNTVDHWAGVYHISAETKQKVLDFIMGLDNLVDVETRVFNGHIEWRYFGKKRWLTIDHEGVL